MYILLARLLEQPHQFVQNSCLFCKKKRTFSILHTHFYKTPTLVYLFYHLFYLNNNISLIFYYIKQNTTHMAPPTSFFLFLTPTLPFSLNHLLLSCFPFPSSFFSLFFLFFNRFLKLKPTSPPPSSHCRHCHIATNNPSQPQLQQPTTAISNLDEVLHGPHLTSSWFWLILEFDFIWFLLVL